MSRMGFAVGTISRSAIAAVHRPGRVSACFGTSEIETLIDARNGFALYTLALKGRNPSFYIQ